MTRFRAALRRCGLLMGKRDAGDIFANDRASVLAVQMIMSNANYEVDSLNAVTATADGFAVVGQAKKGESTGLVFVRFGHDGEDKHASPLSWPVDLNQPEKKLEAVPRKLSSTAGNGDAVLLKVNWNTRSNQRPSASRCASRQAARSSGRCLSTAARQAFSFIPDIMTPRKIGSSWWGRLTLWRRRWPLRNVVAESRCYARSGWQGNNAQVLQRRTRPNPNKQAGPARHRAR